jgi:hypothetical protein
MLVCQLCGTRIKVFSRHPEGLYTRIPWEGRSLYVLSCCEGKARELARDRMIEGWR